MSKLILKIIKKISKNFFTKYLVYFILINISLFLFINKYSDKIKLNRIFYNTSVHFYEDPRINNNKFSFLKSTSVFDAQWYLQIARLGYPKIDLKTEPIDILSIGPHKYAFLPLYPLLLAVTNLLINNLELTALILSNLIMLINFYLIYFFISMVDTKKNAIKTAFLTFVFPLSIFFRFPFAESLFLFLILLFFIYLFKKNYYFSALFLGLSLVTRLNSIPLVLLLLYDFYKNNNKISIKKIISKFIMSILIIAIPVFIWSVFNYLQTKNILAFLTVRGVFVEKNPIINMPVFFIQLLKNFSQVIQFPFLSLHNYADSKIEVVSILITIYLIIKSKNKIHDYRMWWMAFCFCVFPLITSSLMSYSRYQVVSFLLFYFLIKLLNKKLYPVVFTIFTVGLFYLSLYFVNWYWFG
jgi:Gpi18-like mannosyltransferase